ncbi:MAG: ankyrin repeat domain-containing protein [Lyngbya sp. HA4199-MV5]|jgi:ankyrin repeat protein|nr:ankyrin repeat domain-containing protein [Lyngbya sp. HA4199-MV5]
MMQPNLNDIIGMVFDAITGEDATPTVSEAEAKAEFDRLSIAAQAGDTELFHALVAAENQRQRKKSDPSLLMSAVMAGRTDVVRALIAAGADVNAKVEMFFTFDALETAVDKGYTEIVKLLLDAGADPNWNNQNPGLCPIRKACEKGHTDIVRLLIHAGAAVKFDTGFRLLVDAAEKSSQPEIIQLLIDAGCNVNTRNYQSDTPLTAACRRARVSIVHTLIAAKANVNKVGMHDMAPLVTVFLAPKMNEALAGHGLAESESDVPQKITQIVNALVTAGADVNVYDVMGKTALMLAIEQRNFDAAQVLLNAGANVNAVMHPNRDSIFVREATIVCDSALHLAAKANDTDAIALLLNAGADPQLLNSDGIPALKP